MTAKKSLPGGQSNINYRVPLPADLAIQFGMREGTPVKLRQPKPSRILFDQKMWLDEDDILNALSGRLPSIPHVLVTGDGFSIHTYANGDSLGSGRTRAGLPRVTVDELADFFAKLAAIPIDELPLWPPGWPADGDSRGFLRGLVAYTDDEVRQPTWKLYGSILDALGYPVDAMARFAALIPDELTNRPFVLLHGDLHQRNLIRMPDGSLHVIDWELAMVGDPLHDLAIHLVRSCYSPRDQQRFINSWAEAVGRVGKQVVNGLGRDLPLYIDYQRVRSVYTDVARTTDRYMERTYSLSAATKELCRIVGLGLKALGIDERPTHQAAREALVNWRVGNSTRR